MVRNSDGKGGGGNWRDNERKGEKNCRWKQGIGGIVSIGNDWSFWMGMGTVIGMDIRDVIQWMGSNAIIEERLKDVNWEQDQGWVLGMDKG